MPLSYLELRDGIDTQEWLFRGQMAVPSVSCLPWLFSQMLLFSRLLFGDPYPSWCPRHPDCGEEEVSRRAGYVDGTGVCVCMNGEGHLNLDLYFEKWDKPGNRAQLWKPAMYLTIGEEDADFTPCP